MEIVEVDHASGGYTIVAWGELELRDQSAPCPRECRDNDRADPVGNGVAREH